MCGIWGFFVGTFICKRGVGWGHLGNKREGRGGFTLGLGKDGSKWRLRKGRVAGLRKGRGAGLRKGRGAGFGICEFIRGF